MVIIATPGAVSTHARVCMQGFIQGGGGGGDLGYPPQKHFPPQKKIHKVLTLFGIFLGGTCPHTPLGVESPSPNLKSCINPWYVHVSSYQYVHRIIIASEASLSSDLRRPHVGLYVCVYLSIRTAFWSRRAHGRH